MKKLVILVSILSLVLMILACSAPQPTPTPTTAPTPTPTPTPAPQVIKLKYSSDSPSPPNPYEVGHDWFLKEVEKRSNGRVQFERYYSQALNPSAEALKAVGSGIADMAQIVTGYWPGDLPLSNVTILPGLTKDMWAVMKAADELYQLKPLVDELTKLNIKYMAANGTSDYMFLTTKPVTTRSDLNGLRIRTLGMQAELLKELGGVPVGMTAPEVYEALQRGTLDGVAWPPVSHSIFKLHEVAKNLSTLGLGANAFLLPINLNTWNRLPADIQKIFLDAAQGSADEMYRAYHIQGDVEQLNKVMIPAGVKVTEASKADLDKIKEIGSQTVWARWAQQTEAKGLPAKEIMAKFIELVQKYEGKSPVR